MCLGPGIKRVWQKRSMTFAICVLKKQNADKKMWAEMFWGPVIDPQDLSDLLVGHKPATVVRSMFRNLVMMGSAVKIMYSICPICGVGRGANNNYVC